MTTNLTWTEIALRLALTFAAGTLVGINREEHARPAGLRTTLLVCLAASVAMIQTNLLLDTVGKRPDSFIVMDLMRLPLGILSGMGFIGAGAILRKDNLVLGVTTAATLWFVTVMGLCFGGGQYGLGVAALALGLVVLWGLKFVEQNCQQDHRGTLVVAVDVAGPDEDAISGLLRDAQYKIMSMSISYSNHGQEREYNCSLHWRDRSSHVKPPPFLKQLAQFSGVNRLAWQPS